MGKNILVDDFINPKKFHTILLVLFAAFSLWLLGEGVSQYFKINHFLSASTLRNQHHTQEESLEIGNITLTKINSRFARDSTHIYSKKIFASVLNLDHQTPDPQKKRILSHHQVERQPLYGLAGSPSFIIKSDDLPFWRSQMYWQTLINFGGLFVVSIIFLIVYESRYRKDNKLFITPVKNSILTVAFLLFAGVFIKWGLNYRLVHFINEHFYISHLQSNMPSSLYYIAVPVFIFGMWLDQAVRLQKEQDLTI